MLPTPRLHAESPCPRTGCTRHALLAAPGWLPVQSSHPASVSLPGRGTVQVQDSEGPLGRSILRLHWGPVVGPSGDNRLLETVLWAPDDQTQEGPSKPSRAWEGRGWRVGAWEPSFELLARPRPRAVRGRRPGTSGCCWAEAKRPLVSRLCGLVLEAPL